LAAGDEVPWVWPAFVSRHSVGPLVVEAVQSVELSWLGDRWGLAERLFSA
jgi:hypothetical protein